MKKKIVLILSVLVFLLGGCTAHKNIKDGHTAHSFEQTEETTDDFSTDNYLSNNIGNELPTAVISGNVVQLEIIPEFSGDAYVELDGNMPSFRQGELTTASFALYSELDSLGRPGIAYANIGADIMPTAERGGIGQIKPAGWHTIKYDCIDGMYLYNRCHLIGYQLAGENAKVENLMTGTRYLNVQGMLPFENEIADYVSNTNNHVLYRVTPVYEGDNLLATGVQLEAYSVEDDGKGVCFNVFCYNSQPEIVIDYSNGDSCLQEEASYTADNTTAQAEESADYIANKKTHKFHYVWCSSVDDMKEANKWYYHGSRQALMDSGYQPCKRCNP